MFDLCAAGSVVDVEGVVVADLMAAMAEADVLGIWHGDDLD